MPSMTPKGSLGQRLHITPELRSKLRMERSLFLFVVIVYVHLLSLSLFSDLFIPGDLSTQIVNSEANDSEFGEFIITGDDGLQV